MTIDVRNISFQYEDNQILDTISFNVQKGEFLGIFGPNGGGKTTLLKLLIGFLAPKKGTIRVLNKPPKLARNQIGYVPQISSLDRQFPISVLDVVLMGVLDKSIFRSYTVNAKKRALSTLDQLGLLHLQNRHFGSLSGGQIQRVLIARALVGEPSILFLDEPTANVDIEAEERIYQILERLKGSLTILMVTHDLQVMTKKVDRFLCIHRHLTTYSRDQVCSHFIKGLYHPKYPIQT